MNAPLRSFNKTGLLPESPCGDASSARPQAQAADEMFAICGMSDEAHAILRDYDGDLPAFLNDCTSECSGCKRRYFTGYGCCQAEFDDYGRFTCEPCLRRLDSLKAGSSWEGGAA